MRYPNIYALFRERVAEYAGRDVFYVRREGEWRGSSWEKFGEDVEALASALLWPGSRKLEREGLTAGEFRARF